MHFPEIRLLSQISFAIASVILIFLAGLLVVFGLYDLIRSLSTSWNSGRDAVLQAISYVVIAMAVFDVAKYFVEEEVVKPTPHKSVGEARTSLTKFVTTITIGTFIEGLVGIFDVGRSGYNSILYPSAILLVASFIVLTMGVYHWLISPRELGRG